jgi:hypothetical protein
MRRHLPNPLHPGVLHGRIRVEAFGHRFIDEGGAVFAQQLDQLPVLGYGVVDLGGFVIQEVGDDGLFGEGGI